MLRFTELNYTVTEGALEGTNNAINTYITVYKADCCRHACDVESLKK